MKQRRLSRATFIPTAGRALQLRSRPAPFLSEQAWRDLADVDRQIAWYKAQGLIDTGVNRAMWLISELRQMAISSVRRISALASLPVA